MPKRPASDIDTAEEVPIVFTTTDGYIGMFFVPTGTQADWIHMKAHRDFVAWIVSRDEDVCGYNKYHRQHNPEDFKLVNHGPWHLFVKETLVWGKSEEKLYQMWRDSDALQRTYKARLEQLRNDEERTKDYFPTMEEVEAIRKTIRFYSSGEEYVIPAGARKIIGPLKIDE